MKILTIVGARPQFIKAAMLSREISNSDTANEVLVHTGQHHDANMSDVFFNELGIPLPDYNLGIGSGSHGAMTGRQLEAIEQILVREEPDWVVVFGDTNSTLAGALAATKLNIPLAHIEAGLRSYNKAMPEETNRILTDHSSDFLFAPTPKAVANLKAEGFIDTNIFLVGDIMYDATLAYRELAREPEWFKATKSHKAKYILSTIHRAENTDTERRLRNIVVGLGQSGHQVILPMHPRTLKQLKRFNIELPKNIFLAPPVGYLEMLWLEANSALVATDSGGVQKEAYFQGKQCVTLRAETEWTELVDAGVNELVDDSPELIARATNKPLRAIGNTDRYGVGDTASQILSTLLAHRTNEPRAM